MSKNKISKIKELKKGLRNIQEGIKLVKDKETAKLRKGFVNTLVVILKEQLKQAKQENLNRLKERGMLHYEKDLRNKETKEQEENRKHLEAAVKTYKYK